MSAPNACAIIGASKVKVMALKGQRTPDIVSEYRAPY